MEIAVGGLEDVLELSLDTTQLVDPHQELADRILRHSINARSALVGPLETGKVGDTDESAMLHILPAQVRLGVPIEAILATAEYKSCSSGRRP